MREMQGLVGDAERILTAENADFADFGEAPQRDLEDQAHPDRPGHQHPRSTPATNAALAAGAVGGKLLGAGGGGFMVFYVEPELQPRVKQALGNYLHIPFTFDFQGSEIIVYQPEIDYQGRE